MSQLHLYMNPNCPFCHRVMDFAAANNIELDYRNIVENDDWKQDLMQRGGKTMVPYLFDEERGEEMYESSDIIDYLDTNYN